MTLDRDLDRRLVLWFDERSVVTPPSDLLARGLARVDATRQRPGWRFPAVAIGGPATIGRRTMPAWGLLVLVALVLLAALVVVGAQVVRQYLSTLPVQTSPAVVIDSTQPPATPESIPTPSVEPGPLGGGPILAMSWTGSSDPGPFDVVAIDPGTGATTLLGRLPKGERCCGYDFLRNTGLTRVVIVDGVLEDSTAAADRFGFATLSDAAREDDWLSLSPVGDRIAAIHVDSQDMPLEIVVMSLAGDVQTRLPIPAAMNWVGPIWWAPDGRSLLLTGCKPCNKAETPTQKQTAHHAHIYIVPLNGSPWHELLDLDNGQLNEWWSPDGTRLAVNRYPCAEGSFMPRCDPAETLDTLSVLDPATGAETTLVDDVPMISAVDWSPDGTRIAFGALDGAYVVDIASGSLTKVDATHTWSADWSPDSQWLVISHEGPGADAESVVVRADGSDTGIVLTDYTGVGW